MKHMVDAIRTHGLRPGLWLAPVAADKHSKIATEYVPQPSTSKDWQSPGIWGHASSLDIMTSTARPLSSHASSCFLTSEYGAYPFLLRQAPGLDHPAAGQR